MEQEPNSVIEMIYLHHAYLSVVNQIHIFVLEMLDLMQQESNLIRDSMRSLIVQVD